MMLLHTAVGASTGDLLRIFLTVFLLSLSTDVHAQSDGIKFEHFSIDQGMSAGSVPCIYQDRIGYLWFGTFEGVDRYDGYAFTSYRHHPGDAASLVNAYVNTLCEDRAGNFWVGTVRGLERLDRATGKFTHYVPHPSGPATQRSNSVISIYEDREGLLWIGTDDGLNVFDRSNGKFTCFRDDSTDLGAPGYNSIRTICEDRAGSLWIGTGCGLNKFDKKSGKFIHYWHDFTHMDQWGNWTNSIYEDDSGILWLGGGAGLVAFDQRTGTFTQYRHDPKDPRTISSNEVSSISGDKAGQLWVGTYRNGLNVFNKRTKNVTHYVHNKKDPGSLSSNGVQSVYCERSGTIWVSTIDQGVNKLNRAIGAESRFTPFVHDGGSPASLQNNDIRFIYQNSSGRISIGTATGMDYFDRETGVFNHYATWDGPYPITGYLEDGPGSFWTGISGYGINIVRRTPYKRKFFSTLNVGLGGSACSILKDRIGLLWMLISGAGLCQFDPRTEQFKNLGIGQSQSFVSARLIVEDSIDNTANGWVLWIGTNDGLWRYDARADAFTRFGHDPKDPASLASNIVRTVFRDSHGTLWIGTDQGLNRMDSTNGRFECYTERNGLPDNLVLGILEDDHNRLWVSTAKTISKLEPSTKRFVSYRMKGILPDIRFGAGCCLRSTDGEMYFGGDGGLVIFRPDSIKENLYVPPLAITGFKKFDAPVTLDSAISEKKVIELSYKDNVFSFEFVALNFTHPEENQYAYKLEGHDDDWIYCGNQQYARYINVEEGKYLFRVKGSNNNGVWNEEGTSIAVIITPPFWKTWWFETFSFIAMLVSIGGSIRYVEMKKFKRKIEQLENERALERERTRISQDMHDEIGAGLTEIGILSELAKRNIQDPDEAEIHMQRVAETSRETIRSIGEIIWAINPKNDMLDDLVAYLRHYAARYLGTTAIKLEFFIPETIPKFHLSAEARRNIFLVMKETLHNIVKHSGATAVVMHVSFTKQHLAILVKDDGNGFSVGDLSRFGNGLHNMEKRMKDIGGTFEIESEPGQGTGVKVLASLEEG